MRDLWPDVLYAFRMLRRNPLLTLSAVISLALGIGANSAIFTLTDRVLLRLLPVAEPEQLVQLDLRGSRSGRVEGDRMFSNPMYRDIAAQARSYSGILGRKQAGLHLGWKGQTEVARAELVTGNYFDVLGLNPALGRLFTPDDDRIPRGHPVAVLSYGYWVRRFARSADIVGQSVTVNSQPFTVVGVAPEGFQGLGFGDGAQVFVPVMMKGVVMPTWDGITERRTYCLNLIGRLKPGVTVEQATAELTAIVRPLREEELRQLPKAPSKSMRDRWMAATLHVIPAGRGVAGERDLVMNPLLLLGGMVALVLLIACANVANLLMARAAARQKEIAVRLSMGAGRGRLIRQLLVESLMMSVIAGALGLLVALWTYDGLLRFLPSETPVEWLGTAIDGRTLAFTAAVSIACGLLFGLMPALQSTRPDLNGVLKDQAGSTTSGSGGVRFRKTLVAAQVALSLLLLAGAGLFARSLGNLRAVDLGFSVDRVLSFAVDPRLSDYSVARTIDLYKRIQESLAAVPGVRDVSFSAEPVMDNSFSQATVSVEGYQSKEGEDMNPLVNVIGTGYFTTLGIPMIAGRDFTQADGPKSAKVAIVNEKFVEYFFKGQNPLGRKVRFGRSEDEWMEIIAVVKNNRHGEPKEEFRRQLWVPFQQDERLGGVSFYVRTERDPEAMAGAVRRTMNQLDANLPVVALRSLPKTVDGSLLIERMVATLASSFGALATLLAAIGLYGVMAFLVARRTREIGIRIALGAMKGNVLWLVLKDVAVLAGIGIAVGLPLAYALGRAAGSVLYGVKPYDPLVFAGATLILFGVAALAGYLPARHAAKIDPMIALRWE